MSTEAKNKMVASVEEALQDTLTVSMMRKVRAAIEDVLMDYTLEVRPTEGNGQDDDMLTSFLTAKRVEGRSEKTLVRYGYIINKLAKSAGIPLGKIQIGDLRTYLTKEKDRGISDRTLKGERSVFSSFFGWLDKEDVIARNPCANLNPIKYEKKIRIPFSDTDIELMKEVCENSRDRAIIAFLLSTGARISEVCRLNRDDIDYQSLECKVMGKGKKERTVYIDNVASMLLRRYMAERKDDSAALFPGKGSERLTDGGVRSMLKRVERISGVENVHPHRFRRTLATNLINHGMSIQEVAAILGHENINTTMQYVYIEKENVKNNYRRYA